MKHLNLLMSILLLNNVIGSSIVWSAETEEPGLLMKESTFQESFHQTVQDVKHQSPSSFNHTSAEVLFSRTALSELVIKNSYFVVPYHKQAASLPAFQIGVTPHLISMRYLTLDPRVTFGYSFWQGIAEVNSTTGTRQKDVIQMHSFPFGAGFEASMGIQGVPVHVILRPSIGMSWFLQSGSLDGIDTNAWIPFWSLEAGFVLFSNRFHKNNSSWFDGVVITASQEQSLSQSQPYSTSKLSLGARIAL